jgi:hypothetical protein
MQVGLSGPGAFGRDGAAVAPVRGRDICLSRKICIRLAAVVKIRFSARSKLPESGACEFVVRALDCPILDPMLSRMSFTIAHALNGVEQPPIERANAHEAGQQIVYLERDGYTVTAIVDSEGKAITRDELGEIALRSLSASADGGR